MSHSIGGATRMCRTLVCFHRYAEYVVVKDAANLIPLPDNIPLDVAAILPCGALSAYAAVERVKSFIDHKIQTTDGSY